MRLEGIKRFAINFSLHYFKWIWLCFTFLIACPVVAGVLSPSIYVDVKGNVLIQDIPDIIANSISTRDLQYFGADYTQVPSWEPLPILVLRLFSHSRAINIAQALFSILAVSILFFWVLLVEPKMNAWHLIRGKRVEEIS